MFNQFIPYILSLPIVMLALSVHEVSHGYAAYKLGDPTAHSVGRLSLNPLKHIDPLGFLCMLVFKFGWAKPVPINSRYFKKPRRDMALTAAAGPASNILLALVFAILLRLAVLVLEMNFSQEAMELKNTGFSLEASSGFKIMSVLVTMLELGVVLNIGLAIFNLIPIPPFDGSRISYVFLPINLYFKIMKYEQIIMIVILALLSFTPAGDLVSYAIDQMAVFTIKAFGFRDGSNATMLFNIVRTYFNSTLIS